MAGLVHDPLMPFRFGWPVGRGDGLDDLERFLAEPGFRARFRLPGGQFALCARDERTGRVAALRDPSATMPLHAHFDGRQWLVSTSVRAIENLVGRKFALKFEVLKKLHQTLQMVPDESLYHEVELLGPGQVYLFEPSGTFERHPVKIEWPKRVPVARKHWHDLDALVEAAVPIVTRSVIDAVGGQCAIVQQSGGLDSNLILHAGVRAGLDLSAHGLVFPGLDCDESEPMRRSCELVGVQYNPVDYGGKGYAEWKEEMFRCAEYVPFTTTFMWLDLGRRARACGFNVALNGAGGDEVFVCSRDRAVGLLARMRGLGGLRLFPPRLLVRYARGWARRVISGRDRSLESCLKSNGWYFQMSGVQLLMDSGVEIRFPFRDWRLVTQLVPLLMMWHSLPASGARSFQRAVLNGITPELCNRARLGKVHFNSVGKSPSGDSNEFGTPRNTTFGSMVPDFVELRRDKLRQIE